MISQIALNEQFRKNTLSPTQADNISFLGVRVGGGVAPGGSRIFAAGLLRHPQCIDITSELV
jgi:hypothetical protein